MSEHPLDAGCCTPASTGGTNWVALPDNWQPRMRVSLIELVAGVCVESLVFNSAAESARHFPPRECTFNISEYRTPRSLPQHILRGNLGDELTRAHVQIGNWEARKLLRCGTCLRGSSLLMAGRLCRKSGIQ